MSREGYDRYEPLRSGLLLHRRYGAGEPLAETEHEIVYRGIDRQAGQPVCIREFFPRALSRRGADSPAVSPSFKGLGPLFFLASEAYVRQYGALTQAIGSPNLLSVFDAFFENGTAYAVTEQLSGLTLQDYMAAVGRPISQEELVCIAQSLSDALLVVHSLSICHHDLTAASVFLSTDGTVKLTNFGAAKRTVQSRKEADADPGEDLHDLGRTLYTAYTGRAFQGRLLLPAGTEPSVAGMLEQALSAKTGYGFQSVFDFRYAAYALGAESVCPQVTEALIEKWAGRKREVSATERIVSRLQTLSEGEGTAPASRKEAETQSRSKLVKISLIVIGALILGVTLALILRFL